MASSFLLCAAFFCWILCSSVHQAGAQNINIAVTAYTKLDFPPDVAATGSLTFDAWGRGPYAGTVDGRIFRYSQFNQIWQEFGYTTPNRPAGSCNGATGFDDKTATCGFTSGLSFSILEQKLYACDAYVGLTALALSGGEASTLVRGFRSPNSVHAAANGEIYLVDTSAVYSAKESDLSIQKGDSTGRLLQYDPATGGLSTLLAGLGRPVGVTSSADGSFLLVTESSKNRILKYYLRGQAAGRNEIFHNFLLAGRPSKIKRNAEGNFWVAFNTNTQNGGVSPRAMKLSPSGQILAVLDLSNQYQQRIDTVMQHGQQLFVARINFTHVGRYNIVLP